MSPTTSAGPTPSVRVTDAQRRAEARLRHQRDTLRPLGWALIAVVVASVATQHPGLAATGAGLAVTVAVLAFAAATATVVSNRFLDQPVSVQVGVVAVMATAGVALAWLQPRGGTDLAAGAAAWMAITRLPLAAGVAVAAGSAAGQLVATARTGSVATVLAVLLLTTLLSGVAYLMRQSRASQDETELLLAQLADARDAQAEAAVVAERARIAADLHDVLAHSLSGAALQLQGARVLAEREGAAAALTGSIERAARLVADGLVNARHAVGALRGSELPSLAQLDQLMASYRDDLHVDVELHVEGTPHPLPPELGLALYRGAEEALTNVARHAAGAPTQVLLRYGPEATLLEVENLRPQASRNPVEMPGNLGGGNGLAGLRDRLESAGGHLEAGPTPHGWRVSLTVPA